MRLSVILNSARGDTRAIAAQITDACRRQHVDLTIDVSDGASLAATARRAVERGSTTVAAAGGDGTISAVASVLAGTNVTLGVLPQGTLNHFARDLHIPHDVGQAISTILSPHAVQVDVGEVNGRLFINNSSVGLYPRMVWEREHRQRQGQRKWAATVAAAWSVWQHYRRVTVRVEPECSGPARVQTPFVFVGNNTYELTGLDFGSRSRLDAGRLHVCMAPNLSAVGVMGVLAATLVGRLDSFEQFESLEAGELTIDARRSRLGVALDGEMRVLTTPLHFRTHHRALRVAVLACRRLTMDANGSRTVVHLSDLHFGREDRRVLRGLRDAVWTLEPNVVAVSGDLTQRARGSQFRRARAFLDTLPAPRLVVPGNHDLPLFNIAARLLNPLGGYKRFITRDLQPMLSDPVLWITGIDTTQPSRWKGGRVRAAVLDRLQTSLREAPPSAIKILVAHHPFDSPERPAMGTEVLSTLASTGIDVFLTGHLHTSYTGHTAHRYRTGGRTAVVVEAGTASSTRLRGEANGFNVLRVGAETIDVEMHSWDGGAFTLASAQQFSRSDLGWRPD